MGILITKLRLRLSHLNERKSKHCFKTLHSLFSSFLLYYRFSEDEIRTLLSNTCSINAMLICNDANSQFFSLRKSTTIIIIRIHNVQDFLVRHLLSFQCYVFYAIPRYLQILFHKLSVDLILNSSNLL